MPRLVVAHWHGHIDRIKEDKFMPIVLLVIIGAAAGYIATQVMDIRTNVITTIAIGIGGALIGSLLLNVLVSVAGAASGFIGAVLGAMLLIWLWKTYGPRPK